MEIKSYLKILALLLAAVLAFCACAEIDVPGDSSDSSVNAESDIQSGANSVVESIPDGNIESTTDDSVAGNTSSDGETSTQAPSAEPDDSQGEDNSKPDNNNKYEGADNVISFVACPDNIIHPSVYYHALQTAAANAGKEPDYSNLQTADYDFAHIYENISAIVKNADISYINVETLIGGNENPISGYPMFNSPEKAGETLIDLGFDVYNLAHNHMLDSGNDKYLKNCDNFFTQRGGTTIGYYENKADTENIVIYEEQGVKIAFLAYTYATNGISLGASASTYIPYINSDLMKKQMKLAKEKADLVFVSMHWGDEDNFYPNSAQRSAAQLLADEGADVIIGMHPHVIQESKWVTRPDGSRCFLTYSLGNLLSGMYGGKNALGSILSLDIVCKNGEKPYVDNVQITPTVCHYVKKYSVNPKMDTGFRDFKIYLLEDYTAELAAAHGVHQNKGKISGFDNELDGNFSLPTLYGKVKRLIPAEFLPEAINTYN